MLGEAARLGLGFLLSSPLCAYVWSECCIMFCCAEIILQKQRFKVLILLQFTDMMWFEKGPLQLVFLQAAVLMNDKFFKGSKLICLLLGGLICHTHIYRAKCLVCVSNHVSHGL